ncbi:MAG: M15 family metallopeptidase [Ruminococcus sp.]|nr:M15 family metallopeptidase [Ruminococcus sp.]
MKKTKLKLKKQVYIILIVILFLAIGGYAFKNIHEDLEYRKTDEFKLLELGYTNEEIELIKEKVDETTINSLIATEKNEFLIELLNEPYYLNKNLVTYIEYHLENTYKSAKEVISIINTYNNYNAYENDIDTNIEDDYLMIVNKFYHLSEDYAPDDLVNVNNKYYYGDNHKVRKILYDAFIDMWNAAYQEDIYLIINSSYRTYEEQKGVYDDYKNTRGTTYADSVAARPGYSEHQTGLSVDIFSKENTTINSFKDSSAHNWLKNNAYKYGFIERYQESKEDITGFSAEAWHWRYVGVEAATYIYEHDITFDEYYAYFIAS